MTQADDTAPDATPDDSFLNDFLAAYLGDVEGGQQRSLVDYQAMFPGHEEAVADEFENLRKLATDDDHDVTQALAPAPG